MTEKRRKAIVRRRIFIAIMASVLAAIIALLTVLIVAIKNGFNKDDMLYITENADTNLKFASAYTWTQYIGELCEFPVIVF